MRLVDDPDFTLHVGDVREVLRELPDESVHCVVTSPPYWSLRDYGVEGQLGLEATPELYVESMVEVFREVRRVLRRDGTCWVNLGDSYAHGAPGGGSVFDNGRTDGRASYEGDKPRGREKVPTLAPGLKPKDLVGIPWRVAFALQADGWYLRSDIVWSKPNPMPESVTDRPTKAHEYVFLLTRSPRYFYDADAVREPHTAAHIQRRLTRDRPRRGDSRTFTWTSDQEYLHPAGRNLRSVWEIATEPYPEAHFATYPQALVERCLKAGTSERGVCPECGAPWVREVERERDESRPVRRKPLELQATAAGQGTHGISSDSLGYYTKTTTLDWHPTCEHGGGARETEAGSERSAIAPHLKPVAPVALLPVPATVLDPFLGSGTTALVARRLGRRCVGIELSPEYAALAARRLQQLSLFAGAA